MVRRTVLFSATEKAHDEGLEKVITELDTSVKNMVGKIPGLISARVDGNLSPGAHEIVFTAEFAAREDIAPYFDSQLHRAHARAAEPYVQGRVCADIEL